MRWRVYYESKGEPRGSVSYVQDWEGVLARLLALEPDQVFEFRVTEYDPDGLVNQASMRKVPPVEVAS